MVFPVYISDQKFENLMDLLLVIDERSHVMCASKILTDICLIKQIIKTKNTCANDVCSSLVVQMWQDRT